MRMSQVDERGPSKGLPEVDWQSRPACMYNQKLDLVALRRKGTSEAWWWPLLSLLSFSFFSLCLLIFRKSRQMEPRVSCRDGVAVAFFFSFLRDGRVRVKETKREREREREKERGIKKEESKMDEPHKRGQAISSWTDNRCDYSQDVHWWWSVSKISF